MNSDRKWMYQRKLRNGSLNPAFEKGCEEFVDFAFGQMQYMVRGTCRCPCKQCKNGSFTDRFTILGHLGRYGFIPNYYVWSQHGESILYHNRNLNYPGYYQQGESSQQHFPHNSQPEPEYYHEPDHFHTPEPYHEPEYDNNFQPMVMDLGGPNFDPHTEPDQMDPSTRGLYDLLNSSKKPVYEGSSHSQLSTMARMLNIKADHNLSERCFDDMATLFNEVLPDPNHISKSFYDTKKLMEKMGLPVQKIDCCEFYCMLYWKGDRDATFCKFCGTPRYKDEDVGGLTRRKRVARKKMFYLPIIPRLQRLYQSKTSATNMRWHDKTDTPTGFMNHPSDSRAWKHFDETHRHFKADPRNVRLGLCTDGFAAHGQYGVNYSSWPIVLTVYNLPPSLMMKEEYMFLSVICPGPKNPKHKVDVFLQPLIDELQQLWTYGVQTWDASIERSFNMRAALMWTISDFPAYAMLSGWSTAGKKACPYCMDSSSATYLKHGRKVSWFDNTRKFLPHDHHYRKSKSKFFKGKSAKKDVRPAIKTGYQILQEIDNIGLLKITELGAESHNKYIINQTNCGWRKRSIFWDLPYWTTSVRHNLDVMHIEKNFFDNLWNTIMSIPSKTKDNLASKIDLAELCHRPDNGWDDENGCYKKAPYQLNDIQVRAVARWVRNLRFPDGFVSNLSRLVDRDEDTFKSGWKSHDCHIFMQKLLPIALKPFLDQSVWEAITSMSVFFRDLTSKSISVARMLEWEERIPVILCNLEQLFPPSFFDVMEHLVIHLPYEARMAGPVHFRWMYPFERNLGKLKKKVKNKARVEGSIVNAYLTKEAAIFGSHYFGSEVVTNRNRVGRNDDGGAPILIHPDNISVFKFPGRPSGKCVQRRLTRDELKVMHSYILNNCEEVDDYMKIYVSYLRSQDSNITGNEIGTKIYEEFPAWFLAYLNATGEQNDFLLSLAQGPLSKVSTYPIYFINEYKFHTVAYEANKRTKNSGVRLKGTSFANSNTDFYGHLEEVIIVEYLRTPIKRIAMFKCTWFDTQSRGLRVNNEYNMVEVHKDYRYGPYDPFIFADQASQVAFVEYPVAAGPASPWLAVCTVNQRLISDMPLTSGTDEDDLPEFQEDRQMASIPIPISSITINIQIDEFIYIDKNDEEMENLEQEVENDDPTSEFVEDEEYNTDTDDAEDDDEDY